MFLKCDYRNSAIGLIAAFAVLITGAFITGAITPKPVKTIDAAPATIPSQDRPQAKRADDCASAHQCRCGTVC